MRGYFKPDPVIANVFRRIMQDGVAEVDHSIAQQIGRYSDVKQIRQKKLMFIARDDRLNKSILYLKGCSLKEKNGKFLFEI